MRLPKLLMAHILLLAGVAGPFAGAARAEDSILPAPDADAAPMEDDVDLGTEEGFSEDSAGEGAPASAPAALAEEPVKSAAESKKAASSKGVAVKENAADEETLPEAAAPAAVAKSQVKASETAPAAVAKKAGSTKSSKKKSAKKKKKKKSSAALTKPTGKAARTKRRPLGLTKPLTAFELGRYQYCGADADCVLAQNGCCDCANGGEDVAVNKERLAAFRARFDCLYVNCANKEVFPACGTGVVSCVNHKCKYFPDSPLEDKF